MAADKKPTESSKPWSEICEEADPELHVEDKKLYQFSNGRKLEAAGVYDPNA